MRLDLKLSSDYVVQYSIICSMWLHLCMKRFFSIFTFFVTTYNIFNLFNVIREMRKNNNNNKKQQNYNYNLTKIISCV